MKLLRWGVLMSTLCTASVSLGQSTEFTTKVAANGMELVLLPSAKVPLVTIALIFKAGGMTETRDITGLTHLWEHMFFKGNGRLPDQEAFNRRIRQLGIVFNGDTSTETVRYFFTLPSAFLEEGIQFMADAIGTPKLDETEMQKERRVVIDEYDRNASNPSFDMQNLQRRIIYGDLDNRRDALGSRLLIEKVTREQLFRIRDEVFVPANAALIIGGDFRLETIQALVDKHFATWKTPSKWTPVVPPKFQPFPKTQSIVMARPLVQNAQIELTYEGPLARATPEDTYPADILASLLGHKSGKFYAKFLDSGLTFGAGYGYHTQSQAGEMSIYASCKPENAKKVEEMLRQEIAEWAKPGYFTEEQLADVRLQLTIGRKYETNKISDYTKSLGWWWSITGLDYYASYLEKMQNVSLADVQRLVTKYFVGRPYLSSILLSPEGLKASGLTDNSKPLVEKYLADYMAVRDATTGAQ